MERAVQEKQPRHAGRDRPARIPVLTYHAAHADGYDYAGIDHLALEQDLELIRQMGFRVAKLQDVVDFVGGRGKPDLHEGRWVALTFDDAPDCGTQRDYATVGADGWHIPRFVCGQHWRSTRRLAAILTRSGQTH